MSWTKLPFAEYEINLLTHKVRSSKTQRTLKPKALNAYQIMVDGKLKYFKVDKILELLTESRQPQVVEQTESINVSGCRELSQLQDLKLGLESINCPVPQELNDKIKELVDAELNAVLTNVKQKLVDSFERVSCDLNFIVHYSFNEKQVTIKDLEQQPIEILNKAEPEKQQKRKKNRTTFCVQLPNGRVISSGTKNGGTTFANTIKYIGPKRVIDLKLKGGYPIVSLTPFTDTIQQHKIGDYYVYTHFGNSTKVKLLEEINQQLGAKLIIKKMVTPI